MMITYDADDQRRRHAIITDKARRRLMKCGIARWSSSFASAVNNFAILAVLTAMHYW